MSVETITTISPTTNKPILTRNGVSPSELQLLPIAATEAFEKYRKTSLQHRQELVRTALKIAYTAKEISTAVKRGEYLLNISEDALKDTDGEAENGFKRFIRKVPVGPILILFAWNVRFDAVLGLNCC
jgi:acyl-CoA reductase-like NAD-dependent aldehyde dehydrogenase